MAIPPQVTGIHVKNLDISTREKKITWDPSSDPTVTSYNIYRSEVSYGDFEKINTDPITDSFYTDTVPLTEVYPFQWWYKVTAVNPDGESDLAVTLPSTDIDIDAFINQPFDPAVPQALSEQNLLKPDDGTQFQYLRSTKINPRWFLEIRRRHKWLLEMGGTKVWLLKRKYSGQLCPNFDQLRNQHRQMAVGTVDPCYGTKYLGGYHTPINIMISFVNPKVRSVKFKEYGVEIDYTATNWTLWEPNLLDRDIIVRVDNGERYEILNITRTSWRGVILSQRFDLRLIEPTSIIYKIPVPQP